jgi:hypothetical protein
MFMVFLGWLKGWGEWATFTVKGYGYLVALERQSTVRLSFMSAIHDDPVMQSPHKLTLQLPACEWKWFP